MNVRNVEVKNCALEASGASRARIVLNGSAEESLLSV